MEKKGIRAAWWAAQHSQERECHRGSDPPTARGAPSWDFKPRNHLSPFCPVGDGVRSRAWGGEFPTQETSDIKTARGRGRRKVWRREEESGRLQMERSRADVLAQEQTRFQGHESESERWGGNRRVCNDHLGQGDFTWHNGHYTNLIRGLRSSLSRRPFSKVNESQALMCSKTNELWNTMERWPFMHGFCEPVKLGEMRKVTLL